MRFVTARFYDSSLSLRERDILEHAIHAVAEQAIKADDLVDEALDTRLGGSDPLVTHAKMLRLELLNVKADLERELETFSLNCSACGLDVHWVRGLGVSPGHWAHGEPAPHGEPAVYAVASLPEGVGFHRGSKAGERPSAAALLLLVPNPA
jgi:hypothetical protein